VDPADFTLTASGVTGAHIIGVSGTGTTRLVNVSTGVGTGSLRLDVIDNDSIRDAANHPLGGTGTANGRFISGQSYALERTYKSISSALLDGWILESSENSNKGGSQSVSGNIQVGDDVANKQYFSLLSFDTSSLPDTATILKVTLQVKKAGGTGTNPFSTHGQLKADIRSSHFGNSQALETADFQAIPTILNVGFLTAQSGGWYQLLLSPAGIAIINKVGLTQFRLHFTSGDNNDHGADTVSLFSGNSAAGSQPVLLVEYVMP
jgi:hypothetical protein